MSHLIWIYTVSKSTGFIFGAISVKTKVLKKVFECVVCLSAELRFCVRFILTLILNYLVGLVDVRLLVCGVNR